MIISEWPAKSVEGKDVFPYGWFGDNPILRKLHDGQEVYFLTGSHFFHSVSKFSDVDFFTSEDAVGSLFEMGFKETNKYGGVEYADLNTTLVLESLLYHPAVQVQVVKDVGLKRKAQAALYEYRELLRLLPKSKRSLLWDMTFSFIGGGLKNSPRQIEIPKPAPPKPLPELGGAELLKSRFCKTCDSKGITTHFPFFCTDEGCINYR